MILPGWPGFKLGKQGGEKGRGKNKRRKKKIRHKTTHSTNAFPGAVGDQRVAQSPRKPLMDRLKKKKGKSRDEFLDGCSMNRLNKQPVSYQTCGRSSCYLVKINKRYL